MDLEQIQNNCDELSNDYNINKIHPGNAYNIFIDRNDTKSIEKSPEIDETKFNCNCCNYTTHKQSEYNRHLKTRKHLNKINDKNDIQHICDICNKSFKNYNSLWSHKKRKLKECKVPENNLERPEITTELIVQILKQNKDLQNILIEQNKQMIEMSKTQSVSNNISNNNSNNTTNQQFNLQFFLNETCKDAMNITDFVKSLQLTTADFEATGKLGYIEGITRIIVNNLSGVDTNKRPLHCTDAKRETIYIKDDNVWEKEDDKKTKFRKVVNEVANKNLQQLVKWKEEHPDFVTLDTQDNIDFRKYYRAALGGETNEEDDKFFEKIKRNVLKEIVVNKSV